MAATQGEGVKLTLPWPPQQLSPNKRLHWAVVGKYKSRYREACYHTTRSQQRTGSRVFLTPKLALTMVFVAPDRRRYDRDNLVARMKSGLDGMCQALSIDDSMFHSVTASVAEEKDKLNPHVRVYLCELYGKEYTESLGCDCEDGGIHHSRR